MKKYRNNCKHYKRTTALTKRSHKLEIDHAFDCKGFKSLVTESNLKRRLFKELFYMKKDKFAINS